MSDTKLLVAAIDFGSSGVGYAFSFVYQFKTNPIDVHTSIWNKNNSAVTTKIPCVLLFDESKKFDCFGFDAEDKYEDLFNNDGWTYGAMNVYGFFICSGQNVNSLAKST
jgi:hypothetical protein